MKKPPPLLFFLAGIPAKLKPLLLVSFKQWLNAAGTNGALPGESCSSSYSHQLFDESGISNDVEDTSINQEGGLHYPGYHPRQSYKAIWYTCYMLLFALAALLIISKVFR